MRTTIPALILALATPFLPAQAQNSAPAPVVQGLTYADIADMALASKVAAAVRVRRAERLKGAEAATAMRGRKRFLITAEVLALIRAREAISPRITYIMDVAPDASGKFPKFAKGESLIFALPVSGYPGEVRLVSPDAQIAATPDILARVRTIFKEAEGDAAPPIITGVGDAFHVAGAIPGEGETQIFLESADERLTSITVLRTPNAPPRWWVSLGEVVDQGAGPPRRNTLIWYRLACFLPRTLPAISVAGLEPAMAATATEDYAMVMAALGQCPRSLKIRP